MVLLLLLLPSAPAGYAACVAAGCCICPAAAGAAAVAQVLLQHGAGPAIKVDRDVTAAAAGDKAIAGTCRLNCNAVEAESMHVGHKSSWALTNYVKLATQLPVNKVVPVESTVAALLSRGRQDTNQFDFRR